MKRGYRSTAAALSLAVLLPALALAQVPTSLLNEGDPLPSVGAGHVVTSLNNTAVNHAGGYAMNLNSSDGAATLSSIWGHASGGPGAIIRTEGTFGPLVQTSFESFYGFANNGNVGYSASGTGGPVGSFDSVWKDDTPIAVEGDPYPHAANTWWRFGSRPGITADSSPYFVGGLTYTQGGSTQNYGLFYGDAAMPVLLGGDVVPNIPDPLGTSSTVSFDYRYSALGTTYLAEVTTTAATGANHAMVLGGVGLLLDGSLVIEGSPVPPAVGGIGGEPWDNFDFCGVTEAGEYFFTGDTGGDATTDEFILKNGQIILREGDMLDGEVLSGSIEGAYMNEDGDLAFIWDIQANTLEALYLNDTLLLKEGDPVDLTGDGLIDPGTAISSFTGISALTLSDRDLTGRVYVYFTADVDTAGTSSTTDDIEGFYCQAVDLGPVAVTFSSTGAYPVPRSQSVMVQWATSMEHNHDGFNVYRSRRLDGAWDRLNGGLVRGQSPYAFEDTDVQRATTYYYRIGAVDFDGREELSNIFEVRTPMWGVRTALFGNSPNPFVRRTEIQFALSRESDARLTIFDVTGRKVRTLVDGRLDAGEHGFWWDGVAEDGRLAAGGVYFYRLEADGVSQTRKMVQLVRR
jgi:hypothetical protein